MYSERQKMADLMTEHPELLGMIGLFGIGMGVDNYTIKEICDKYGVDCQTFLGVLHYHLYHQKVDPRQVDIPTLRRFIENGHTFYLKSLLPRLRQLLIEAVNPADETSKVPILILQFYDDYVRQIRAHIQKEKAGSVHAHEEGDKHIAKKLSELTNLIIKYYPSGDEPMKSPFLHTLVQMIHTTEMEILVHCDIEDNILAPALRVAEPEEDATGEELSEREQEVIIEVVRGYRNKEIAARLNLSIHTILSHRKNIARKLNIHSTSGLTIYALVNHLISLDELK